MIVELDKMIVPSSREFAQHLYDKNKELENKCRRSVQARIPSDPNAWQQMRENYESIILEDHAFSEEHCIEYALWQLHYRQFEEFRTLFNSAQASVPPNTPLGGKGPQPDRISKIRLQFKTFLSEATGFYHDLLFKIRAKYGLPFSEDSDSQPMENGGTKSAELKKGLVSSHRCLIYLGDLARYKGLYVEGGSKSPDYAAASSYYLQAASLWPSSGNPHHQLAILASYGGDELVSVYWYFRSLAVDFPFLTARDNLIVAFEKNRQCFTQLPGVAKASAPKEPNIWMNVKGRGKKGAKITYKDASVEVSAPSDASSSITDTFKLFCIRFVRLNGILFTRTSLETFEEVLSAVITGFRGLLSSGTEEKLSFAEDALKNALVIVRLISILIFTVHNVNKQVEGQTYAEILQRDVLLKNAFIAVFELMSNILSRCVELHDPSSSYLLPGILIFLEWLACSPDLTKVSDEDEKQAAVRSIFWNHYISLMNKIMSSGLVSIDFDEDETCFFNMSSYEEGENEKRLALWEDFELRGFLPVFPAQIILDFSNKYYFANDEDKERKVRLRRVLAAGKVLRNTVRIGEKTIWFDPNVKKFLIGIEPEKVDKFTVANLSMPKSDGVVQGPPETLQPKPQFCPLEEEEEEEEIVFKPAIYEKQHEAMNHTMLAQNTLDSDNCVAQRTLSNGLKFTESAQPWEPEMGIPHSDPFSPGIQQPVNSVVNGFSSYGQIGVSESMIPSKDMFCVCTDSLVVGNTSSTSASRNPVSRPVRHLGPPPGFSQVPPKHANGVLSGADASGGENESPVMDDYSWLDGYRFPDSLTGPGLCNSIGQVTIADNKMIGKSNGISRTVGFPFPGKQVQAMEFQGEMHNIWNNSRAEDIKYYRQPNNGNQQFTSVPEQYHQGSSIWSGQYFV